MSYTYDSLQRLVRAETPAWGTQYGYDGFGNLWTKGSVQGKPNPTPYSTTYNRWTNRQDGGSYDANGNPATINGSWVVWDVENRLAYGDGYQGYDWDYPNQYQYDPSGKRVQGPGADGQVRVSLYNLGGQILYQADCPKDLYNPTCSTVESYRYFGGKLLKLTDRLGSVRARYNPSTFQWERPSYYPYGEEKDAPQADGTVKFATYLRDGPGLDYAMNRYYSAGLGRFYNPDPGGVKTANPTDPGSWNRYGYAGGDPVNAHDPKGLRWEMVGFGAVVTSWNVETGFQYEDYVLYEWDPDYLMPMFSYNEGGGGGGGAPYYQQHPCDKTDETNAKIFNFIAAQSAQAQVVANETGLSAEFIMGWASYESAWGESNAATKNNNYFGLTAGNNSVHWAGSDPYSTCQVQGYDCFTTQLSGIQASAVAALTSFGNKYLKAALAVMAEGGSDTDIAQAIVNAGFNSEYGPGVYAGIVDRRAQMIKTREDCLK